MALISCFLIYSFNLPPIKNYWPNFSFTQFHISLFSLQYIGLAIYFFYGLRHSLVGLRLKMKSHVKLKQRPCVLAKNLCQFEYDMDVIPAHRDLAEGKTSPISPIFWSSLQKYHFFATDHDERDDIHGFYWFKWNKIWYTCISKSTLERKIEEQHLLLASFPQQQRTNKRRFFSLANHVYELMFSRVNPPPRARPFAG